MKLFITRILVWMLRRLAGKRGVIVGVDFNLEDGNRVVVSPRAGEDHAMIVVDTKFNLPVTVNSK